MTKANPYFITGENRPSNWLITCDHASNHIPDHYDANLGLSQEDLDRHIAYDIGAIGVSECLAKELDCPMIASHFSRLLIDPNRGENDPTLIMQLYDGSIIPANKNISDNAIQTRLDEYYRPYHGALAHLAARQEDTIICAIHSFTPQLQGKAKRPWQIGILSAYDKRFTAPFIEALRANEALQSKAHSLGEELCIGDNEPYDGDLPGDAIDKHALQHGRLNLLIELRSDLIETPSEQSQWASLLAPILRETLSKIGAP